MNSFLIDMNKGLISWVLWRNKRMNT